MISATVLELVFGNRGDQTRGTARKRISVQHHPCQLGSDFVRGLQAAIIIPIPSERAIVVDQLIGFHFSRLFSFLPLILAIA